MKGGYDILWVICFMHVIIIRSFECHMNITCTYWYLTPNGYYMILPALIISAAMVTTIIGLALHSGVLQK